jgi:group I intron endonuclease
MTKNYLENNYTIYQHTCPGGKSYVGYTKDYKRRCRHHREPLNHCTAIAEAIIEYGWDRFTHKILKENLTKELAIYWEGYYIDKNNTLYPNGYNLMTGGETVKASEETRKKLTGRKLSPEHIAKRSLAQTGIKRSIGTREKISASQKGKKLSLEHKAKLSVSSSKSVIRSDGKEFASVNLAAEEMGCFASNISRVLTGRRNTIHGFKFIYKQENKPNFISRYLEKDLSVPINALVNDAYRDLLHEKAGETT